MEPQTEIPAVAGEEKPPEGSGEVTEVSAHRRFTDLWVACYQERFSSRYFFNGAKDGAAVSRLLAAGEQVDDLICLAKRAWAELGTGFLYQQSISIAGFASRLNEIRAMLTASHGSGAQRPAWSEIRELENERRPLAHELEEWNALLQHDANRTQENIDKRKAVRERVEAIDQRLTELRKA